MPAPPDAPWEAWPLERDGASRGDPEAIHRLRVAANRLRAAHDLSGSAAPSRLLKLARALGRVRSLDLHRSLVASLACEADSWPERAQETALTRIARARRSALKALRRRLRTSPFQPCGPPAAPALPCCMEDLHALAQGAERGIEALHDLRRALRGLRYALEWRAPSDPSLDALKRLTWTLGQHRDWRLCEAFLARLASRWSRRGRPRMAAGARALGEEAALRRGELEAALASLAKAFLEARRAEGRPGA